MITVAVISNHTEFKNALADVLRQFAGKLSASEMLAVAAQVTGMILALQDRTKMTPEDAMDIIACNVAQGNAAAIEQFLTDVIAGNA